MTTELDNQLPVADTWYHTDAVADQLTLITEPHVKPLLAANTWLLHGSKADLFIDCGLGVRSLHQELPGLVEKTPAVVVTHGHLDHMGSAHEFSQVWVHGLEQIDRTGMGSLNPQSLAEILGAPAQSFGTDILIDALPNDGYDYRDYQCTPATPTRALAHGDRIDLGDVSLTVWHLPGHTPGSIALYEHERKWLFTGDVIYDEGGDMIDYFRDSSPADYRSSMRTLLTLDVESVFAGHGPVFGADRLHALAERYLSLDEDSSRTNTYQ